MGEIQSQPKQLTQKQIINHYKIKYKIGEGSFGKVYKVIHLTLGDIFAIKIQSKATNPYVEEDTKKEVDFLKLTKDIKETIDFVENFEDKENTYIVVELCTEGSLEDYILDYGPMEPETALEVFEQISSGVKKLHDLGIIHRDLKPLNILLTNKKKKKKGKKGKLKLQAKIIDFGLSKKTEIFYSTSGTKEFAAPEYFNCHFDSLKDNTIDVWALGCILFFMLTGRKAFYDYNNTKGAELVLDIESLKRGDIKVDKYVSDLDFRQLILLCVKVDPAERIDAESLLKFIKKLKTVRILREGTSLDVNRELAFNKDYREILNFNFHSSKKIYMMVKGKDKKNKIQGINFVIMDFNVCDFLTDDRGYIFYMVYKEKEKKRKLYVFDENRRIIKELRDHVTYYPNQSIKKSPENGHIFLRQTNRILEFSFDPEELELKKVNQYQFLLRKVGNSSDKICQFVAEFNKVTGKTENVYAITSNGLLQSVSFDGVINSFNEINPENRFFEAIALHKNFLAVNAFNKNQGKAQNLIYLYKIQKNEKNFEKKLEKCGVVRVRSSAKHGYNPFLYMKFYQFEKSIPLLLAIESSTAKLHIFILQHTVLLKVNKTFDILPVEWSPSLLIYSPPHLTHIEFKQDCSGFYASLSDGRIFEVNLVFSKNGKVKECFEESSEEGEGMIEQDVEEGFRATLQKLGLRTKCGYTENLRLFYLMKESNCFFDYSPYVNEKNFFEEDFQAGDKSYSLGTFVKVFGKFELKNAVFILIQIANFLKGIQDCGTLHGSLTSEDVLIRFEGGQFYIQVLNYFKKLKFDLNDVNILSEDDIRYSAPEMYEESGLISNLSDIWSLGCLFYELVEGKKLFELNEEEKKQNIDFFKTMKRNVTKNFQLKNLEISDEKNMRYIKNLLSLMLQREASKRSTAKNLIRYLKNEITLHEANIENGESSQSLFFENFDDVNYRKYKVWMNLKMTVEDFGIEKFKS